MHRGMPVWYRSKVQCKKKTEAASSMCACVLTPRFLALIEPLMQQYHIVFSIGRIQGRRNSCFKRRCQQGLVRWNKLFVLGPLPDNGKLIRTKKNLPPLGAKMFKSIYFFARCAVTNDALGRMNTQL